jgi:hypothetical protein
MKKIISLTVLLWLSYTALADLPPKNFPYTLQSANKAYYLKSIPYRLFGEAGRTYVYNSKTGQALYTIDMYFGETIFLSNDGQYIVSVSAKNGQDGKKIYGSAIRFYNMTTMVKNYRVEDIVSDKSKLRYSMSYVYWRYDLSYFDKKQNTWIYPTDSLRTQMERNNAYTSNDTLYVTTVEKKTFAFNIPTGEIIKKRNATRFFKVKSNYVFPVANRKEKLPDFNKLPIDLPPFTNEKDDFSQSLSGFLNYKPAKDAYYCNVMVSIRLIMDRKTGEFEIRELEALKKEMTGTDKNGDIIFFDSKAVKQKILDWLKGKRFQTNNLPAWMEKWYFDKEYYLNYQ